MQHFLHITYSGAGGMTEAVLTLVEAARRAPDTRHTLLFYGADPLPDRVRARCAGLGVPHEYIPKRRGNDWSSLLRIGAYLERTRPDAVCSHMTQPLAPLLCHRLAHPRCRIVSIEHHSNALKSPKDWFLTCANHLFTQHTVYLTAPYRDEVRRRLGPLFRPRKTGVIPNGIDTARFSPPDTPPGAPPLRVGMSARMVPGKDFGTLLRAFALLAGRGAPGALRLQLAGDGPLRPSFAALARELAIADSVDFLGELAQDDLITAMRGWHMFVLSTLGETMSRSIMEAQALGLPIVATAAPGVGSSLEPGITGLLVQPEDPAEMAGALQRLVDAPELRAELGRGAREKALREFSAERIWGKYEDLFYTKIST